MTEPIRDDQPPPFAGLEPGVVLDALETVGLRGDGRLLALASYENRVYQVYLEDDAPPTGRDGSVPREPESAWARGPAAAPPRGSVVVKFYRPGRWTDEQIGEEHAFVAELASAEIPAVPPLVLDGRTLHRYAGFRFAVYPRQGGRVAELESAQALERIGRFLARIHAIGAARPFVHRPALDVASFGEEPRAYLLAAGWVPADLVPAWTSIVDRALDAIRGAWSRAGEVATLRLHGDCYAGNILWTDSGPTPGPHFVDFDDSRTGPAVQDLWMLLSGSRDEMCAQLAHVLRGYEDFRDFDDRELVLVEALRTLRLIHYSAWLARRWHDPAFPAAFPWFGTQRYWQDRVLELREQVAAIDEPPLVAR
jgi:Ser/Thr protein kinase RdoA (MazF antagonist)